MRRALALLFVAALSVPAALLLALPSRIAAGAEAPPELTVPRAEGLVLDGKPTEEAWAKAAAIPAETIGGLTPSVRVLYSGGRLFVALEVAEDPGFPVGVRLMIAADGTATAAEAAGLSFAPQELRGPRYVAHGPRGEGRAHYRLQGAADVSRKGAWSIEASLPIADLGLSKPDAPLRLSVAVALRTPNMISSAPAKTAMREPAAFALLKPPEGGWTGADAGPAPEELAKEDAADAARLAAFDEFRRARYQAGKQPFATLEAAKAALIGPLDKAIAARADLTALLWLRGAMKMDLGDAEGAEKDFSAALVGMPFFREAKWGLVRILVDRWTTPAATEPSDYEAAFARIANEAKTRGEDDDAVRISRGILEYRRGGFAAAIALLGPIVKAHPELDPQSDMIPSTAKSAELYAQAWAQELASRKADDAKADAPLPRCRVKTSKGDFILELFEDDAPNTVANFIWLAKAGFYEGTTFHRVIPFFMAQGGDPLSKTGDPKTGQGGPGWAIKMEPSRPPGRVRRFFRGMVGMAHTRPNDEGSQFFVTTGSSANLDGDYSLFGRVLEGQDVVDRLVVGDKILKVEVVRARDHEYRPVTVAGTKAPELPTPPK